MTSVVLKRLGPNNGTFLWGITSSLKVVRFKNKNKSESKHCTYGKFLKRLNYFSTVFWLFAMSRRRMSNSQDVFIACRVGDVRWLEKITTREKEKHSVMSKRDGKVSVKMRKTLYWSDEAILAKVDSAMNERTYVSNFCEGKKWLQ